MPIPVMKWLGLGCLIWGLSACISVLPEPEAPDALYRIDAASAPQSLPVNLLVRGPSAPQIVAGQAFVSEDASGAIRLVSNVEWAERSTRLIQLALVDSFSLEGDGTAILSDSGLIAGFELLSRVQSFALRGEDAVCEMTVLIAKVPDASVLDRREIRVVRQVDGTRSRDRALAMKAAAEGCVSEMAVFAAQSLNGMGLPAS